MTRATRNDFGRRLIAALPFRERSRTVTRRTAYHIRKLPIPAVYDPKTLAERLRKKRYDLRLRQSDVARMLGVNRALVSLWEWERVIPCPKNAKAIPEFLSRSCG